MFATSGLRPSGERSVTCTTTTLAIGGSLSGLPAGASVTLQDNGGNNLTLNTSSDSSNCGACGNVCAPGETCSSGRCTCGSASVSFSSAVQPIFTTSCALSGCHAGAAPKEGMNLSSGKAYTNVVNVLASECSNGRLRVKPSDPANSYVIDKLTNVSICFGTQMPKTGGSLPSPEIATIANWICEGAPNN